MKPILYTVGHNAFGDCFGICAAAHIISKHESRTVQVSFWDAFKELATYFDGVEFIHQNQRGEFQCVDVGADPFFSTPQHNGISRFLRFMGRDSTDTRIEMNISAHPSPDCVSIVPNGNMNRSISPSLLKTLLDRAKCFYPRHRFRLIGHRTDVSRYADLIAEHGIVDEFTDDRTCHVVIEQIRRTALMIAPHTGLCFPALAMGVRLWCERSINPLHDYLLDLPNGCAVWFNRQ